jgi:hypothetical protein
MKPRMIPKSGHRFSGKIMRKQKWTPKSHNGQTVVRPSQALGSISGTCGAKPLSAVPSY